jgi:hypothetical protein
VAAEQKRQGEIWKGKTTGVERREAADRGQKEGAGAREGVLGAG